MRCRHRRVDGSSCKKLALQNQTKCHVHNQPPNSTIVRFAFGDNVAVMADAREEGPSDVTLEKKRRLEALRRQLEAEKAEVEQIQQHAIEQKEAQDLERIRQANEKVEAERARAALQARLAQEERDREAQTTRERERRERDVKEAQEAERRENARREQERQKIERRERERQEREKQYQERQEIERRERQESEKRQIDLQEAERRDKERRESERRGHEQREIERRERERQGTEQRARERDPGRETPIQREPSQEISPPLSDRWRSQEYLKERQAAEDAIKAAQQRQEAAWRATQRAELESLRKEPDQERLTSRLEVVHPPEPIQANPIWKQAWSSKQSDLPPPYSPIPSLEQSGFYIGQKKFSAISGAVSLVHLQPINPQTDPTLTLFGDELWGAFGACGAVPGEVLEVASPEFVAALNSLGSRERPVLLAVQEFHLTPEVATMLEFPERAREVDKSVKQRASLEKNAVYKLGMIMEPCVSKNGLCPYPNVDVVFTDLRQLVVAPSNVLLRYFWDHLILLSLKAISESFDEQATRTTFAAWKAAFQLVTQRLDVNPQNLGRKLENAVFACIRNREDVWTVLNPVAPFHHNSLIVKHIRLLPAAQVSQWQTWLTQFFVSDASSLANVDEKTVRTFVANLLSQLQAGSPKEVPAESRDLAALASYSAQAAYDMYADSYFLLRFYTKHTNVEKVVGYLENRHALSLKRFFVEVKRSHRVAYEIGEEKFVKNFIQLRCLRFTNRSFRLS